VAAWFLLWFVLLCRDNSEKCPEWSNTLRGALGSAHKRKSPQLMHAPLVFSGAGRGERLIGAESLCASA
jgi:hypothetical protein